MKFSTRARYGLRMMIELARLQGNGRLIQLHRIAKITGLSNNYLAQLAISLKDDGLIIGVSGKKGGYQLARSPEKINVGEIIKAVQGPIYVTECVVNPDICLNAEFCEGRAIWGILTHRIKQTLEEFTLADLIPTGCIDDLRKKNPEVSYLFLKRMVIDPEDCDREAIPGTCQQSARSGQDKEMD